MADYKGLNIVFRADATEATKALHLISQEAKAAQGGLTAAENGLKNVATNGKSLNDALRNLQIKAVGDQARLASEKFNAYSQILEKQQTIYAGLQTRLDNARDALAQLGSKWDEAGGKADAYASRVQGTMQGVASAAEALESCKNGTAEYAEAQERLKDAQAANVAALEQYKAALDETFTTFGTAEGRVNALEEKERTVAESIERTNANMLEQQAQAQALEEKVRILNDVFEASQTGMYQFGEKAKEWGASMKSVGDSISSVGDKMTIVSGVALATFGRQVVSSTEDFGNSIAQLGGYLDISGTALDKMSDQALEWGKETQFSAGEAAQAMNELAKGGMTEAQISGGAMEATMQLAAAGELDMASAAETAVQAIKTFGLEAADSGAIADALAGAANKSTAEVTDLAAGFKYAGAQASLAGWDINEVTGALALMADHGLRGEMAGTALANVMKRLATPTDTAREVMEQYGIEVRNADGTMKGAVEVVQELQDKLGGLNDAAKSQALNDIFQTRGLVGAVALLDEGTEKFQGYIDATKQAGYASEMAESRMGDLGWALEYLRGELETASVNLGQALAPTIIEVAKAIEGAVAAFNNLDEGTQRNIAQMALVVTAAGPVLSIVGHLTSGIGGFVSALGTGAQTLATFAQTAGNGASVIHNLAESYAAVTMPAEKVMAATAGIERSLTLLATGGAVALGAVVAGALVDSFVKYQQHAKLVSEATDGVITTIQSAEHNFESMAASVDLASASMRSMDELSSDAKESLQSVVDVTNSFKDRLGDVAVDSSMLQAYADQIDELTSKTKLTPPELDKLKNAVDSFNQIAGTSISVVNDQTGALSAQPEVIRQVADAYRDYAESVAYIDLINDATKTLTKNQYELNKSRTELDTTIQAGKDAMGAWGESIELNGPKVQELRKHIDELSKSNADLGEFIDYLNGKLDESNMSSGEYEQMLNDLGVAAKDTGGDFSDAGEEIEDAMEGAAEATEDAAERMITALKRAQEDDYTIAKRGYEDKYNERKAELDREYQLAKDSYDKDYDLASDEMDKQLDLWEKSYKESYDLRKSELGKQYDLLADELDNEYDLLADELSKQVDLLSKELSSAYDARKKALDNETKALSDSLAKQLDARKKELSKEYDAIKSAMDKAVEAQRDALAKQLSAVKAQHSAQEAALKKSLDAQYKQRQKELQKEYKERQKQNQKALKDAKAAQKAETESFKAETKERIAQIKAEYEAKKRYLEDHDGTKEIDAQIKAIEDQQAAEDEARKQRERAEKTSELRTAVERAKTRKTRQEAEDALSEYLRQLAEEDADAERERQIQALEDRKDQIAEETKAKQEALDEERDARLEAYQQQRDDELAALEERQSAAYDLLSEKLAEQLELYQEHNNQILEAYRAELDAELQALEDRHAAEQERIAEANNAYIEQMRARNEAVLEGIKEANDAETAMMAEANAARVQEAKDAASAELDAIKESNAAIIEQRKADNAAQLESLKEANGARLEEVKAQHEAELKSLADAHEQEKQQREANNEATLQSMKDFAEQQLQATKEANDAILTQQKRDNEDALTELKRAQEDEMENLKNSLEKGKEDVVKTSESALVDSKAWLEKLPEAWRESGEKSGDEMGKALEGKRGTITTSAKNALADTSSWLDEHVKKWKDAGGKGADEHAKEIESKGTTIEKATKSVTDKSGKVVDDSGKEIKKKVETTAKTDVPKAIESGQSTTKSSVEKITKVVDDALKKSATDAKNSGQKVGTEFANGIQSSSSNVSNAAQQIANNLTNALRSAEQGMRNSGYNAGIGFANGLNSSAGQIYSTANQIAQNVVNTINSALQVHSPSRKTMETGRYTIEGLIEGMERKRNELLLAAERVARDMAESLDPNVDIDSTMEKMTRELERTKQEQHEQLSKLREQAAEDLDWAIRSGASPEAVRQIDEDYARLIGTMTVEQNKTISELSKAQERQLNLLREQKAHAEQAIREGRSLNGETRRAAEEISKSIATDTSDNDYSGPFDVRALDESAAEYVETYAVALNKIEQMAYEHHVRMSNIGTAYGFGGLAASANQVDLSGFATSVTNALTTAIGNMRVTCGTTIVVENMTVREEADIRRISRELNRMMEHSANARGGAR